MCLKYCAMSMNHRKTIKNMLLQYLSYSTTPCVSVSTWPPHLHLQHMHTHTDLDLVRGMGRTGCDLYSLLEPTTASNTKQVLRESESIFIMTSFSKKPPRSLTSWHSCSCVGHSHMEWRWPVWPAWRITSSLQSLALGEASRHVIRTLRQPPLWGGPRSELLGLLPTVVWVNHPGNGSSAPVNPSFDCKPGLPCLFQRDPKPEPLS